LNSYEGHWAIQSQRHAEKFDPIQQLVAYYTPLREITQSIDVIPASVSLSTYKVVVAPAFNMISPEQAANLISYVRGGGNLVLGPRSAMKTEDDAWQPLRQPGPLEGLLGARVDEYYALSADVPISGELGDMQGTIWAELLSTSQPDAEVVMRYGKSNGWLDGRPAMVTRKVGKGSITYIGACFGDSGMQALAHWMQTRFGLTTPLPGVPGGVEASQRYGTDHVVTLHGNLTQSPADVPLPRPMEDVLAGGTVSSVHLPAYGVAVLNSKK
jgi:beta-galactosidase